MNLVDVMDQVAARLDQIEGLRVFAYPPDSLSPPAGIVDYPDDITFDETYGRGMDRLTLPVIVTVGKYTDRSTKPALAAYCNGSGAQSIKQVLESGAYTAFHTVRVMSVEIQPHTIGGTDYAAAVFNLDIAGSGT